ncbi:MAG TPA: hypothetical protein VEH06_08445 [Candidatus Bathyarchaeia archaeon]|nr:hypothetical protein [Candidatus Bathyarchaeia archaeon]
MVFIYTRIFITLIQNILFALITSAVVAATLVATPVIIISYQNAFAFAGDMGSPPVKSTTGIGVF